MPVKLFDQVDALLKQGGRALPPVQGWHPPLSGDIDIRIARDGSWHHDGAPMTRESIVRLFASILRREGDEYFLVTPVEKWRLRVEDVPFTVVDVESMGSGENGELVFRTNVDDRVHANPLHPLRVVVDAATGEPSPYVMVRDGLEAKLSRSVYYRLVEIAAHREEGGETVAGVWSGGQFFEVGRF